jgi:hypothetical protein
MTAHFVINSMLIEVTVWDYNIKLGPIVFISTFNGLPRPQLYGSEIYEYLWISILVSIITEFGLQSAAMCIRCNTFEVAKIEKRKL